MVTFQKAQIRNGPVVSLLTLFLVSWSHKIPQLEKFIGRWIVKLIFTGQDDLPNGNSAKASAWWSIWGEILQLVFENSHAALASSAEAIFWAALCKTSLHCVLVLVGEPHCLDAEEPREADVRDGLPLPPTSQLHSGSGQDYLGIEDHLM